MYCMSTDYSIACIDMCSLFTQLTKEIKRVGVKQIDGTVCTTFRKLHRETEGIFPDFMSTLMAAKRYQVSGEQCLLIKMHRYLCVTIFIVADCELYRVQA